MLEYVFIGITIFIAIIYGIKLQIQKEKGQLTKDQYQEKMKLSFQIIAIMLILMFLISGLTIIIKGKAEITTKMGMSAFSVDYHEDPISIILILVLHLIFIITLSYYIFKKEIFENNNNNLNPNENISNNEKRNKYIRRIINIIIFIIVIFIMKKYNII